MAQLTRRQLNESRGDLDIPSSEPVPERHQGTNIPYRGTEQHGQLHKNTFEDPPTHDRGYTPVYEKPEPEPEPIPVKVVQDYARELKKCIFYQRPSGTNQGTSGLVSPALIVQGRYGRTKLTVKNAMTSAFTIYIADTQGGCHPTTGWSLQFGESVTLSTEGEIWAWADSASAGTLNVIEEYSIEL